MRVCGGSCVCNAIAIAAMEKLYRNGKLYLPKQVSVYVPAQRAVYGSLANVTYRSLSPTRIRLFFSRSASLRNAERDCPLAAGIT